MSIECNDLPGVVESSLEAILTPCIVVCDECGWAGVVLEYLPAFGGLAAFGNNGLEYCPECGEIFAIPASE